jgi:hypothetical protein
MGELGRFVLDFTRGFASACLAANGFNQNPSGYPAVQYRSKAAGFSAPGWRDDVSSWARRSEIVP